MEWRTGITEQLWQDKTKAFEIARVNGQWLFIEYLFDGKKTYSNEQKQNTIDDVFQVWNKAINTHLAMQA